jgi:outer membrane protein TolC|tara:strand:- start:472 stop:1998 length:1527 start_codon:yes stop_codon:yes gene_type:complete
MKKILFFKRSLYFFSLFLIPVSVANANEPLSLTLQETIETVLKNNISISVQSYNSKINEQFIFEKEADFDPTVDFEFTVGEETRQSASTLADSKTRDLDYDWDFSVSQKFVTGGDYELTMDNNKNQSSSSRTSLNPIYSSDLALTVTQPLLKDFGIDLNKREIYIAKNDQKISDHQFTEKVIATIAETENIYWDLVFSIEDLKVKETSLQRARDLEKQVKAQVDVGTLAELEILQAKSNVASREERLLNAQNLIDDNGDNLKSILNFSFDSEEGLKEIIPADSPVFEPGAENSLEEALKTALIHRPDLLAKKMELENRNIEAKYNENQTLPTLDLVGSLGLNGLSGDSSTKNGSYDSALSEAFSTDFRLWQFGINLSYPLGNRAAKSKLAIKRLEVAQLLLNIKDLEKTIVVEVREAHRQIKTDIKRVQATRVARKLAEEKLNAEEKKFKVGLSTSFNVLEFQEDLAEEQSNEIKAVIDYNKSLNRLNQVMARTLEAHDIKLFSKEDS